jgi:adenine-specific DNA-methyltransferase
MSKKQKLELTWIGKENRPRLEPRILLEDPEKSHHAKHRVTEKDQFDNRLIFGDNLLALKALEQEFAGKVQCVYIDPPFNTQQAFEHYDDGIEHSVWLSLMRDRLEILHRLLHPTGSLFIHIDDTELGYLIALADEVFGRKNRVSVIAFKQSSASGPKAVNPGLVTTTNFILYYAKDKSVWKSFKVFVPTQRDDRYSKFIENYEESFERWRLINLKEGFSRQHQAPWTSLKSKFADKLESKMEEFVLENSERVVRTARVIPKDVNEEARAALLQSMDNHGRVFRSERSGKEDYYFLDGEQLLFYRSKTRYINGKITTAAAASNIWDDLLSNNLHKEGGVAFPNGKKPEFLLKRILELSTEFGDIVLDSFAGSGTTGAVAHKMGRRWLMAELGEHCHTHVLPRLKSVVNGSDVSGITEAVDWKGGGGFRYYRIAPSLLTQDKWGNWVISKEFNAPMLAEAVCKLEGFNYAPSDSVYWQHGHSTERDFLYVTTANLNHEQLQALSDEVGTERSLLVVCSAFRGRKDGYANLTVKKIPKAVLSRCEWGHDDYSLQVENLPKAPAKPGQIDLI